MNAPIKNISLKFVCNADWYNMPVIDGKRHCNHCQKTVYDFTDAKQQEFLQILAENNYDLCGRFTRQQLEPKTLALPMWKKWASAALILIGFNMIGNKVLAQKAQDTIPNTQQPENKASEDKVFGGVSELQPEFPGGIIAFQKFIDLNLKKIKGAAGKKIIALFVVETDGTLTDIKISRGINPEADKEALRILKLSPKWRPELQNGKLARVAYSVPIMFK